MSFKERNAKIIAYKQSHPCATLQSIGDYYGISRERVRQILNRNDIDTSPHLITRGNCPVCDNTLDCHHKAFCSKKCYIAHSKIQVKCSTCGTMFTRRASYLIRAANNSLYKGTGVYCSRKCFLSYVGNNYGKYNLIAQHQKVSRDNKPTHDYVWLEHLKTGFGSTRLARRLDMNQFTVESILYAKRKSLKPA